MLKEQSKTTLSELYATQDPFHRQLTFNDKLALAQTKAKEEQARNGKKRKVIDLEEDEPKSPTKVSKDVHEMTKAELEEEDKRLKRELTLLKRKQDTVSRLLLEIGFEEAEMKDL